MDKKEAKKVYEILKKQKSNIEAMIDVCTVYKIPYLLSAYKNVLSVMTELMEDIEGLK